MPFFLFFGLQGHEIPKNMMSGELLSLTNDKQAYE
jgi:hypothetical protein